MSNSLKGISYVYSNAYIVHIMSEIFNSLTGIMRKEIDKPEWRQQVLEPMNKWIFGVMWPYALGIIVLNFFMTIGAVSLVLYFAIMKPMKSHSAIPSSISISS